MYCVILCWSRAVMQLVLAGLPPCRPSRGYTCPHCPAPPVTRSGLTGARARVHSWSPVFSRAWWASAFIYFLLEMHLRHLILQARCAVGFILLFYLSSVTPPPGRAVSLVLTSWSLSCIDMPSCCTAVSTLTSSSWRSDWQPHCTALTRSTAAQCSPLIMRPKQNKLSTIGLY